MRHAEHQLSVGTGHIALARPDVELAHITAAWLNGFLVDKCCGFRLALMFELVDK